jgi:hypothetical protein
MKYCLQCGVNHAELSACPNMYLFSQTPRSIEYQNGFNDGYNVARQRMLDLANSMKPVETQTFTAKI